MKLKPLSQHGNLKTAYWNYFGNLCQIEENHVIDKDRQYCSLCFNKQKTLGDKGHLSKVCNFVSKTSTGNINLHLSLKHEISIRSEEKSAKILNYFKTYGGENSSGAISNHEINRELFYLDNSRFTFI